MKLSSGLVALAALVGAGVNAQAVCPSVALRREVRSLSPADWAMTVDVLTRMNANGWTQWFSSLHQQNFMLIHGNEIFFPFHRRLLADFESVARRFNPRFAIPYWDVTRDYANMAASAVLSSRYIGGNGVAPNNCVVNGFPFNANLTYPNRHCLQRQFNNNGQIYTMYSPEHVLSVLQKATNMATFRPKIELSLHGSLHISLSGDMIQKWSPNDFAFWMHHANLDRVWFVWQMRNPAQNFWAADGKDSQGKPIGLSTRLPAYNTLIGDTMYPGRNGMCFTYDDYVSPATKRRSLEPRNRKCRHRDGGSGGILGPLKGLVDGVLADVNDIVGNSEQAVVGAIATGMPAHLHDKWFPNINNTATYTANDIPPNPLPPVAGPAAAPDTDTSGLQAPPAVPPCASEMDKPNDTLATDEPYVMFDAGVAGPKYPMANPYPFTKHLIKMHGYSEAEVKAAYAESLEFTRDMNAAKYQSPFAGGVASLISNLGNTVGNVLDSAGL
ncbi:hypothetical protein H4R18_003470 [Coemansia javaensis]|uniref:Tyrosinase copper-binding domain-containing protein n=1 Tax=Coemansia javaensis TaxID=2761396 RepID=A0A9W8LII4_9FUNG|nr:hypothetical protein H4R18_003470 [Coemansia javaensis]